MAFRLLYQCPTMGRHPVLNFSEQEEIAMSFSISSFFTAVQDSFGSDEFVDVKRSLKVRLENQEATQIDGETKLRIQDGSKPPESVSVKDYLGNPGQDSKYQGMGDPATRLNQLLTHSQYRHASNDAKPDQDGFLVEPNGAANAPLQRPKVSVEVERSKLRAGDRVLDADNGAAIVALPGEAK